MVVVDVTAYDPVASNEMASRFPEVEYADTAADALDDGALVLTGWHEFSELETEFDAMLTPVVVDGRRCIER